MPSVSLQMPLIGEIRIWDDFECASAKSHDLHPIYSDQENILAREF